LASADFSSSAASVPVLEQRAMAHFLLFLHTFINLATFHFYFVKNWFIFYECVSLIRGALAHKKCCTVPYVFVMLFPPILEKSARLLEKAQSAQSF
jgi:hypothetical protein